MAQLIKYLPHKHKNLSSDPKLHINKRPNRAAYSCNPNVGKTKIKGSEVRRLASLDSLVSSRSVRNPFSIKKVAPEEQHPRLTSGLASTCTYTHVQPHGYTHPFTQNTQSYTYGSRKPRMHTVLDSTLYTRNKKMTRQLRFALTQSPWETRVTTQLTEPGGHQGAQH